MHEILSEAEYESRIGRENNSDALPGSATEKSTEATSSRETSLQDGLADPANVINESAQYEKEEGTSDVSGSNVSELLLQKIQQLENENKDLKKQIGALKEKNTSDPSVNESEVHCIIENILKPIFSKTQIDAIISKKYVRHWPDEDISTALTLRSMSPKCYEYLRTKKGIPLPCKSTLNERAKNFDCEPGILHSVLSLMKTKSDSVSPQERLCVISLDEMSIASEWSYDKGKDILYKPHDKVQVVMLSGLVAKWKQPIYYGYDISDMHEILISLIKEVECAGYPVVAIVHDLGSSNLKLWKDFGIDPVAKKNFL